MILDNDLNEKNFLLYAMKEYNNPQCIDIEEFNDDLRKIKVIVRWVSDEIPMSPRGNEFVLQSSCFIRALKRRILIAYKILPENQRFSLRLNFYSTDTDEVDTTSTTT